MRDLIQGLGGYLHQVLGASVKAVPWSDQGRLPLFLQERYACYRGVVLNYPLLFAVAKSRSESLAGVEKHLTQMGQWWSDPVVLVIDRLESHERRRLIEHKAPFVVPGNQMYLPMLGIDLREHFRAAKSKKQAFSPATQALLLMALYEGRPDRRMPYGDHLYAKELEGVLGYAPMTLSRAINELESAELGVAEREGRKRMFRFTRPKRETWKAALAYLASPVVRTHRVRMRLRECPGHPAGFSALARYSMLSEPEDTTYAIQRQQWRDLRGREAVEERHINDYGGLLIEIWSYNPGLFAGPGKPVDRLSLYLAMRHERDERVDIALDDLLGGAPW